MKAKYEVRPATPAMGNALLMAAVGLVCALATTALIPATGWSLQEGQIHVSGLQLLATAWDNFVRELPLSNFRDDLRSTYELRVDTALASSVIGAMIGFVTAFAATPLVDLREHYDGPQLLRGKSARVAAKGAMAGRRRSGGKPIELVEGVPYPRSWRVLNLLIIGAIGSGKTRIILWLLDQFIGHVRGPKPSDHTILVHDTTGEILDGFPLEDGEFAALHPHRPGGWGWAMGRDLLTTEDIEEAADQGVDSTNEAMWGKGASSLNAGCMMTARGEYGQSWGMPELYRIAMLPPREMKARFESHYPLAAQLIEFDTSGELSKTSVGILLTFRASVLRTLRPLAEAWRDLSDDRLFSFREWVFQTGRKEQPRIVVLQRSGRHPAMSALWIGMALDAIVSHVGDEMLTVSQSRTRTLVLDELPALGRLRRLPELLDTGRNKGVCTIASVQDLPQIERIYESFAASLKMRFRLKIFGAQTPGPELKDITEKEIGMRRVIDKRCGSQGHDEQTRNDHVDTVPVVSEAHLAHRLGVRRGRVAAILVGLGMEPLQLDWPMRVWRKQR